MRALFVGGVVVLALTSVLASSPASRCRGQVSRPPFPLGAGPFSGMVKSDNCTTCANKETCCGGEICCDGGSSCCPGSSTCCDGICCDSNAQSCCPDKTHGGICCERETSSCCPAVPALGMASHCCPRWYVCCEKGRYGCCDPGTGLAMEVFEAKRHAALSEASAARPYRPRIDPHASSMTTHVMMTMGQFVKDGLPLVSFPLDPTTGTRGDHVQVSGFEDWGEDTRVFTSGPGGSFVLPQANFTGPGRDQSRPIHLYIVDPSAGTTRVVPVTANSAQDWLGAQQQPLGLVTGFAPAPGSSGSTLIMATRRYVDATGKVPGYLFWNVDVASGSAVLAATQTPPAAPAVDTYAGWFHNVVEVQGRQIAIRVGDKDVVQQTGPGLAFTDVTVSTTGPAEAATAFVEVTAQGYQPFLQRCVVRSVSGSTVTLLTTATPSSGLSSEIAVFQWNATLSGSGSDFKVTATTPELVSKLGNLHTTPHFGPVGFSLSSDGNTFVALGVHDSIDPTYDLWAVATYNFESGKQETKLLYPPALADTNGISGLRVD